MSITLEDKARIVARAFFIDNPDQFEDYHEALTEFMDKKKERIIEFGVKPYIQPIDGHELWTNNDGLVVSLRLSDGYIEPRIEFTEEQWEEMKAKIETVIDNNEDLDFQGVLHHSGWRKIG